MRHQPHCSSWTQLLQTGQLFWEVVSFGIVISQFHSRKPAIVVIASHQALTKGTMDIPSKSHSDNGLSASERTTPSEQSSVSFSTIEIHEHAMILGDGRSASGCGPCLEIDWTEQSNIILNLEEYESMRYHRRHKNELIMPGTMRTDLLLDSGYTMREISELTSASRSKPSASKKVMNKLSKVFCKSR